MLRLDDYPLSVRYPPYVDSDADRERFDLCQAIAERQVELYGEGGPDTQYVFLMTRWLFHSDIATGTPSDGPSP